MERSAWPANILCDQQLPTRAGETVFVVGGERVIRAARKIDARRLGSFHVTPIVVLTSYSGHEDFVSKMYDIGASAFMSKPLRGHQERLLDKVSVSLERAKRGTHEECAAHAAPMAEALASDAPESPRAGGFAEQLGAKTFAEIGIKIVDGHTARITCERKRLSATYIDLGLANRMRTPTLQWSLLLDVCAGHGVFRWKKYGTFSNAKQNVYVLRGKLKAAFGLDEDPFHAYRVVDGWRAKFFASSELSDEGR